MNNIFIHSIYMFSNIKEVSNIPKLYYFLNIESTNRIYNIYFKNKEMYE